MHLSKKDRKRIKCVFLIRCDGIKAIKGQQMKFLERGVLSVVLLGYACFLYCEVYFNRRSIR